MTLLAAVRRKGHRRSARPSEPRPGPQRSPARLRMQPRLPSRPRSALTHGPPAPPASASLLLASRPCFLKVTCPPLVPGAFLCQLEKTQMPQFDNQGLLRVRRSTLHSFFSPSPFSNALSLLQVRTISVTLQPPSLRCPPRACLDHQSRPFGPLESHLTFKV